MSYYIVIILYIGIIYNLLKLILNYPCPQVPQCSGIRNHFKHCLFSYNKGDSHCTQLLLQSSISTYCKQSVDNHLTKWLRPVPLSAKLVYLPYSLPILYQKLKQIATAVGQNFIISSNFSFILLLMLEAMSVYIRQKEVDIHQKGKGM